MRIGIGKKVGSFYIGTSVSGKKATKGILLLFFWPFYLMYYIFVWPFVALHKHFSKQNNQSKLITYQEAQNLIRIAHDCGRICETTKNPDTYFSRLDLMLETNQKLAAVENKIKFQGVKPSQILAVFEAQKIDTINEFIDRYAKDIRLKIYDLSMEKAKINKANSFRNTLSEYNEKMQPENIEYYNIIADDLLELAKKPIQ